MLYVLLNKASHMSQSLVSSHFAGDLINTAVKAAAVKAAARQVTAGPAAHAAAHPPPKSPSGSHSGRSSEPKRVERDHVPLKREDSSGDAGSR